MLKSALNPDAPEFHPIADTSLEPSAEKGYMDMNKAVRTANTFPIGNSLDMFKTVTGFNVVVCKLRKNTITQSNEIPLVEPPVNSCQSDEDEGTTIERVADVNDSTLDRVNVSIDELSGERGVTIAIPQQPAAWNREPAQRLATIQMNGASASLIGAKNIPRPQLSFKEPVDNSNKIFVPRIKNKPNNIRPLALSIVCDDEGKPIGYEHPYKLELKVYTAPPWALEDDDAAEIPAPPPLEDTPLTMVESPAALDALVAHLASVREIAVDLEHHSYRTYLGITCLIQVSTDEGGDFIVDALALREHLHLLNHAFTDPNKIKVFHGAEQDVLWLQRDFGVYVVGMFDTHQGARALQLPAASLKHMLKRYCDVDLDKTHQLADWRTRPLPAELVQYARADTHSLLHVWRRMRRELRRLPGDALAAVFHNSRQICAATYVKPALTEESHLGVYQRSGKRFTSAQLGALRAAWRWRDAQARELDESPAYLVPNHMLLAVAETLPRDLQGLRAICNPMPPFLHHNLDTLHSIVLASRELPEEPVVFPMPASVLGMVPAPQDHSLLELDHDYIPELLAQDHRVEPAAGARPDVRAFYSPRRSLDAPLPNDKRKQLNAEAQTFVPPFQRYCSYRIVSQGEEKEALKKTEARVSALSRGNQLIREEVLQQGAYSPKPEPGTSQGARAPAPGTSQGARAPAPGTSQGASSPVPGTSQGVPAPATGASKQAPAPAKQPEDIDELNTSNSSQRKRKISDKRHQKKGKCENTPPQEPAAAHPQRYASARYTKYYTNKSYKQPKTK